MRTLASGNCGCPRPSTQRVDSTKRRPHCVARYSKGPKEQLVLGIETSCDDTGVAIVSSSGRLLGETLATQSEIHAPWGGVVPKLAQEAHQEAIDRCVDEVLAIAGISAGELDAVAVTIGPGLSLCLKVGVSKARQLSRQHNLPMVHVHHMEAHALVARMGQGTAPRPTTFPFLCLLVSGGHNLLLQVNAVGSYVQLGSTMDDALGEAYDKIARMLGLDLKPNGGAALEALAREGNHQAYKFVRPLLKYKTCDFSYAGLKTAVRLCIEKNLGHVEDAGTGPASSDSGPSPSGQLQEDPARRQIKADIAASFQFVATNHLIDRVKRAIQWTREDSSKPLQHLVVAGGVASNAHIRSRLAALVEEEGIELVMPLPKWCTDNGVMVAWAGVERMQLGLVEPPAEPLGHAEVHSAASAAVGGPAESAATNIPEVQSPADEEWIELRPRWPLTTDIHPNCTPPSNQKSARKARMFTSLTELTNAQLPASPC